MKLPSLMQAKKKPLEKYTVEELGIDISPRLAVAKYAEPKRAKPVVKVADVDELLAKLKEAKAI